MILACLIVCYVENYDILVQLIFILGICCIIISYKVPCYFMLLLTNKHWLFFWKFLASSVYLIASDNWITTDLVFHVA